MEASRKRHASSTWRAILAGREALQEGLFKRVGDGESTNIWRHKWISNHFAGQPITPSNGHQLVNVSELMTENGDWNTELIKNTFLSIDADAILRQPRGRIGQDFWAWSPEKSGIYSVRSAYKLLYGKKVDRNQDQVPGSSSDGLWKKLWKIKVPPKVRVFWWRVSNDFLAARQVLFKRHIEPVPFCETVVFRQSLSNMC